MAEIKFKGNAVHTSGKLPAVGSKAPDFELTKADLSSVNLESHAGQTRILSIFPSADTAVCATSTRRFNEKAAKLPKTVVLTISRDLPFALKRFCAAEGIDHVVMLSELRNRSFGEAYGVEIVDGPLAGLLARAVVVIGPDDKVRYTELVPEIAQEPNYDAALAAATRG
jgi:thiol peroxidase